MHPIKNSEKCIKCGQLTIDDGGAYCNADYCHKNLPHEYFQALMEEGHTYTRKNNRIRQTR